ncbi:MAG: hypothetical protein R3F11_30100 [Verrucomicrobiales bacterium]
MRVTTEPGGNKYYYDGASASFSDCIIEPGMAAATCHATTLIADPADRYVLAVMDVREQPANFSGGTGRATPVCGRRRPTTTRTGRRRSWATSSG